MTTPQTFGQQIKNFGVDFTVAFALFWVIAGVAGSTESHAFFNIVPSELVATSDAMRLLGVTITPTEHLAQISAAARDAYMAAAHGPVFATPVHDGRITLAILSLAFATMAAFNLAVVRHVRRVVVAGSKFSGFSAK